MEKEISPDSETPKIDKVKVLGITWKTETTRLVVFFGDIIEICENIFLTKHNILCILTAFYDPIS